MACEECAKGFFVSFDYADGALTEIGRFFKQTGRVIVPLTVREIAPPSPAAVSLRSALDEQIAHKLA
jgi:hypothetical protein